MEAPQPDRQALAIASLVLGVLNLLSWLLPICGVPMGIAGLVVGIIAINSQQRGMAIAGVVMSGIGVLLSIINAALGAWLFLQG